MARTRTTLSVLGAVVVLGAVGIYALTSQDTPSGETLGQQSTVQTSSPGPAAETPGDQAAVGTVSEAPAVEVSTDDSLIKLEAAGIEYSGWPEMVLSVNGQEIAIVTVDNKVRKIYEFHVPASLGQVETITVRMTRDTNCKEAVFIAAHQCTDRTLILRKLWLNDEQIEDPVATGDRNYPWAVVSSEGEVTWTVIGQT